METAEIVQSGRSLAVRLPKEFRLQGKEVLIRHFADGVLLLPIDTSWATLEAALQEFEPEFKPEREQPEAEKRKAIAS
ncbi:MAG: AbrB/MazE/SpoVT family DNA-binding domain-containing protein [Chlorobium limicola]|nr:AbrB/MazE/SpoVT family DNA-binding domain-containing protein [Chlorobium limicola]